MKFKIRASAANHIMAGNIGLTAAQQTELEDYFSREKGTHPNGLKLTDNMLAKMAELIHKRDNPELPEGAKTYCKQWLKEELYNRRTEVKSKYIAKGHENEEASFTLMAVQLKLGMVYKNELFMQDEWMTGTCDLDHEKTDTIYDAKSCWSIDTFPMFEDTIPNKDYEAQIKVYCHLYGRSHGSVVYTLTDTPIDILRNELRYVSDDNERQRIAMNHVFTAKAWEETKRVLFPAADDVEFIEIPAEKRIKEFKFDADPAFIEDLKKRVDLCRAYIGGLLS